MSLVSQEVNPSPVFDYGNFFNKYTLDNNKRLCDHTLEKANVYLDTIDDLLKDITSFLGDPTTKYISTIDKYLKKLSSVYRLLQKGYVGSFYHSNDIFSMCRDSKFGLRVYDLKDKISNTLDELAVLKKENNAKISASSSGFSSRLKKTGLISTSGNLDAFTVPSNVVTFFNTNLPQRKSKLVALSDSRPVKSQPDFAGGLLSSARSASSMVADGLQRSGQWVDSHRAESVALGLTVLAADALITKGAFTSSAAKVAPLALAVSPFAVQLVKSSNQAQQNGVRY